MIPALASLQSVDLFPSTVMSLRFATATIFRCRESMRYGIVLMTEEHDYGEESARGNDGESPLVCISR